MECPWTSVDIPGISMDLQILLCPGPIFPGVSRNSTMFVQIRTGHQIRTSNQILFSSILTCKVGDSVKPPQTEIGVMSRWNNMTLSVFESDKVRQSEEKGVNYFVSGWWYSESQRNASMYLHACNGKRELYADAQARMKQPSWKYRSHSIMVPCNPNSIRVSLSSLFSTFSNYCRFSVSWPISRNQSFTHQFTLSGCLLTTHIHPFNHSFSRNSGHNRTGS